MIHLRVGLRVEDMALGHQLLAQGLVIFNHPVVHQMKTAGMIRVGMGVGLGDGAVSGPPRVADTQRATDGIFFDFFGEVGNTAHGLSNRDRIRIKKGDAGGVIPPVFQAAKSVQKDGEGICRANASNNSTHNNSNVTISKRPRKLTSHDNPTLLFV